MSHGHTYSTSSLIDFYKDYALNCHVTAIVLSLMWSFIHIRD